MSGLGWFPVLGGRLANGRGNVYKAFFIDEGFSSLMLGMNINVWVGISVNLRTY